MDVRCRCCWLMVIAGCGRTGTFAFVEIEEEEPRVCAIAGDASVGLPLRCEGAPGEARGYWRFDRTLDGGVAPDDGEHGNPGTIVGATPIDDGAFGAALRFSGQDHVTAQGDALEPELAVSITAWVRPSDLSADSWSSVVSNGGITDTKNTYWLGYFRRALRVHTSDREVHPSLLDDVDRSAHVGAWHHLAATVDTCSGEIAIYVDGELAITSDDAPSALVYDGAPLRIGTDTNLGETEYGFVGDIDEVKLFGCALTAAQVADDAARNWPFSR